MYSPDVILCGWLGLQHQLTKLTLSCSNGCQSLVYVMVTLTHVLVYPSLQKLHWCLLQPAVRNVTDTYPTYLFLFSSCTDDCGSVVFITLTLVHCFFKGVLLIVKAWVHHADTYFNLPSNAYCWLLKPESIVLSRSHNSLPFLAIVVLTIVKALALSR